MRALTFCLLALTLYACLPTETPPIEAPILAAFPVPPKPEPVPEDTLPVLPPIDYDTTAWTELIRLDPDFVIDVRYATDSNFVDTIMYECGRCFLRPKVAQAVLAAHEDLKELGYRLLLLDCYRPRPVQWRLWNKVPDPRYVSDPRKGSMHNRGAAVDLTLADTTGRELDMGTPFDFFGQEAYPAYTGHPDSILQRRKLLSETMIRHGFRAIRTEWWHFAYVGGGYALADWEWPCD